MNDRIKVVQEKMSELIDLLRGSVEQISATLDTLDDEVRGLRGRWSGEASDAYDRAQKQWTVQLREFTALLEHHRSSAAHAQDVFHEARQRNEQIWS